MLPAAAVPAAAKDFRPGDVRVCNAVRCISITDTATLRALSRFYYGGPAPAEVRAPRLGAPYFQLKFRNGYVTGIAASAQLDRFRSGGVNMGQFTLQDWYRVPKPVAAGLRKLRPRRCGRCASPRRRSLRPAPARTRRAASQPARLDYRRAMRRADVIAIALAVAAGRARATPRAPGRWPAGSARSCWRALALRARSAQYIVVWAVAPLLFWATYPDPSASLAAIALGGLRALRAAERARAPGRGRATA